jgi:hypothetical protein
MVDIDEYMNDFYIVLYLNQLVLMYVYEEYMLYHYNYLILILEN